MIQSRPSQSPTHPQTYGFAYLFGDSTSCRSRCPRSPVRHDPDMSQRIDVPGGGHIELPDSGDGYASALIRRGSDEAVLWEVLPPGGEGDSWVSVSLRGDNVTANSWSCWLVEFDLATGSETARHFTKRASAHAAHRASS